MISTDGTIIRLGYALFQTRSSWCESPHDPPSPNQPAQASPLSMRIPPPWTINERQNPNLSYSVRMTEAEQTLPSFFSFCFCLNNLQVKCTLYSVSGFVVFCAVFACQIGTKTCFTSSPHVLGCDTWELTIPRCLAIRDMRPTSAPLKLSLGRLASC